MIEGKRQGEARSGEASMPDGPACPGRIICFGGAAIDRKYVAQHAIQAGTSNPVSGSLDFGGVARNVAVNLARLRVPTSLVSVVGDDADGRSIIQHLRDLGIDADGVRAISGLRTAEYVALLEPKGSLVVGMADMAIFDHLALGDLSATLSRSADPDWIFAEGNLPSAVLNGVIGGQVRGSAKLAVNAVSAPKAGRLPHDLDRIDLLFLNLDEAASFLNVDLQDLAPEEALRRLQDRGAREIVLTLGPQGLALSAASGEVMHVSAVPGKVVDVTGAGDALIATTLAFRRDGAAAASAARMGALAATLTLEQQGSTCPGLSREMLASAAGRLGPNSPMASMGQSR